MGKVLSILVALLAIWGALANIAPDVFQVRKADRLMEFLWGPKTIWLVLLIGGLFIAAFMYSVDRRLETARDKKDDRLRRELSESSKADLLRFQAESVSITAIREARIRIDMHDYTGAIRAALECYGAAQSGNTNYIAHAFDAMSDALEASGRDSSVIVPDQVVAVRNMLLNYRTLHSDPRATKLKALIDQRI